MHLWCCQTVCGFDLLRHHGQPFVCDVNGWSCVKGSPKFYEDLAQIVRRMTLSKLRPSLLKSIARQHAPVLSQSPGCATDGSARDDGAEEELRAVVAVSEGSRLRTDRRATDAAVV